MIVDLEGLDGVGKSTQAARLSRHYTGLGVSVGCQHFPIYESATGQKIKEYLFGIRKFDTLKEAMVMFTANRKEFWDKGSGKQRDLWKNELVILDRFTNSNLLHQVCLLPEDAWKDTAEWLYDLEYNQLGIPRPDLVICLVAENECIQHNLESRKMNQGYQLDLIEEDMARNMKGHKFARWAALNLDWRLVNCTDMHGRVLSEVMIRRKISDIIDEYR